MKVFRIVASLCLVVALVSMAGLFYYRQIGHFYTASIYKPFCAWGLAMIAFTGALRAIRKAAPCLLVLAGAFMTYGIGDVFMSWGEGYAIVGMGTFLVGHIAYICAIVLSDRIPSEKVFPYYASDKKRKQCAIIAGVFEAVSVSSLTIYLYITSGDLVFAGTGFFYINAFSVIIACVCKYMHERKQVLLALFGTIIYAVSDFAIAFRHLFGVQAFVRQFIMATYYAGLFCFLGVFLPVIHRAIQASPQKPKLN